MYGPIPHIFKLTKKRCHCRPATDFDGNELVRSSIRPEQRRHAGPPTVRLRTRSVCGDLDVLNYFLRSESPSTDNWRKSNAIAVRLQVSTDHELVKSSTRPEQRQHADPTVTSRRKPVRCGDLEVLSLVRSEFPSTDDWGKGNVIAVRLQVSTDHELVKSSTRPEQRQHADPTVTSRRKPVRCGDLEVLIIIRNGSTSSWTNKEAVFLSFSYGFQRIWILDRIPPSGPNNINTPICFAS